MDNKTKKDYRDRSKIDMSDDNEINYVLRTWGVTREELIEAYNVTGSNSRKRLYKYLTTPKSKP